MDAKVKLNLKLLSAYLTLPFLGGLFDFVFRNNQSMYLLYCALLMITTAFIMYAWYYYDSEYFKYKRSVILNIMIVAVSIISIPGYLYRTRGFKKGSIKSVIFLLLLITYIILAIIGTYIGDNYISKNECKIKQEYNVEVMTNTLNMQFESIPIDDALRLLGDFIGYKILRPNDFNWDYKIKINYVNQAWKDVFQDICRTNELYCFINEDETIHVIPASYPDINKYIKPECLIY
jgi:hypothetical protein